MELWYLYSRVETGLHSTKGHRASLIAYLHFFTFTKQIHFRDFAIATCFLQFGIQEKELRIQQKE